MKDGELKTMNRRISLAMTAQENVESEWAKQYWDNVLAYLLKQARRLH